MMSGPAGAPNPLEVSRGCHDIVLGHGVTVCPVKVVGPLINIFWPGLFQPAPGFSVTDQGDSTRGEDAHDFLVGNSRYIIGNDQVYEVVDVGEGASGQKVGGDRTIVRCGSDGLANAGKGSCIAGQSLDLVPFVGQ